MRNIVIIVCVLFLCSCAAIQSKTKSNFITKEQYEKGTKQAFENGAVYGAYAMGILLQRKDKPKDDKTVANEIKRIAKEKFFEEQKKAKKK